MILKLLAFGIAKDILGGPSVEMEIAGDDITAAGLKTLLQQNYPRLKQLSSFMLAVNNGYSNGDERITQLDEIAVIPPVSGG